MVQVTPEKCSIWSDVSDFVVLIGRIIWAFLCSAVHCVIPRRKKSLEDAIVLITGAGKGLGRELALKFAELKAIVVLWDIDEKSIESVQSEILQSDGRAYKYVCDVSDEFEVRRAGKLVQEQVGDVTVLVNNAGILQNLPFLELDSGRIKKTFEINILAHFWTTRYFLPRMLELEEGHIVASGSAGGLLGWLFMADYCATKFGIIGLMEVLEEEVRHLGKEEMIRFTTVCPFTMDTGMNQNPTCRLPKILPLLNAKESAAEIVDAVQREDRLITLPRKYYYPLLISRLFPRKITQLVFDYMQYNLLPNNAKVQVK